MTEPAQDDLLTAPASDTEEGTDGQHPDWLLADKYGSVEDQAKAYPEAEKRLQRALADADRERKERERLSEQIGDLTDLVQQQNTNTAAQGYDPMQHPLIRGGQDAFDQGDFLGVAVALQQLMAQTQAQPATESRGARLDPFHVHELHERVASRYEADENLRDQALQVMSTNPALTQALNALENNPDATLGDLEPIVETAYRSAKYDMLVAGQNQSLAQQQAEQETARRRKVEAQTESPTGGTRVAPKSEQDKVRESIWGADLGGIRIGDTN